MADYTISYRPYIEIELFGEMDEEGIFVELENMTFELSDWGWRWVGEGPEDALLGLTRIAKANDKTVRNSVFTELDTVLPWEVFEQWLKKSGQFEEAVRGFIYAVTGDNKVWYWGDDLVEFEASSIRDWLYTEYSDLYGDGRLLVDIYVDKDALFEAVAKDWYDWAVDLLNKVSSFSEFERIVQQEYPDAETEIYYFISEHGEVVEITLTVDDDELAKAAMEAWGDTSITIPYDELSDKMDELREAVEKLQQKKEKEQGKEE